MERTPGRTRAALAALAAAVSLIFAARAAADDVYLKGGGKLSGLIVERTPTMLVLETAPGRVGVPLARVTRVVEGESALGEYAERAERLGAHDAAGWLELAQWAHAHDLLTQTREAAERVLALEPRNAEAQGLLGNVPFKGRWMSPDDAQRARGLVLFEGDWITPGERADLLRARQESELAETTRVEAEARAREAEARAREAEADARRAESEERDTDRSANGVPLWPGGSGVIVGGRPWPAPGCAGDCGPGQGQGHHGHADGGASAPPRRAPAPKPQPLVGPSRHSGGSSPRPHNDNEDPNGRSSIQH